MEDTIKLPHKLTLNERSQLTMTGVTEVLSFDEETVVLRTCMGILTVHGEGLQLKNLSLEGGQAAVHGTVVAMVYEQPRSERGWLGRLRR